MIIIGYPGVGKTTLCGIENRIIDLESSFFHGSVKEKNWEERYCETALDLSRQGFTVCISSHMEVCLKIKELYNPYTDSVVVIYPSPTNKMKKLWIDKLAKRMTDSQSYTDETQISKRIYDKNKRSLERAKMHYLDDTKALSELDFCKIEISTTKYDLMGPINDAMKFGCPMSVILRIIDENDPVESFINDVKETANVDVCTEEVSYSLTGPMLKQMCELLRRSDKTEEDNP